MITNRCVVALLFLQLLASWPETEARKHHLVLRNDARKYFKLSSFGYLPGGSLTVDVPEFSVEPYLLNARFGLVLAKTASDTLLPYLEGHRDRCILLDDITTKNDVSDIGLMSMIMDFKTQQIHVTPSPALATIKIFSQTDLQQEMVGDNWQQLNRLASSSANTIEMKKRVKEGNIVYSFKFKVLMMDESQEGLYSLFFNNCPNYAINRKMKSHTKVNMSMFITEKNLDNYLSGGEMPLIDLYFVLSAIFLVLAMIWVQVIFKKRKMASKVHYLMGLLIFVMSFALLSRGVNYYFLAKQGIQSELWAMVCYMMLLLDSTLFTVTVLLLGSGWGLLKHSLSEMDKKIFLTAIPLQLLSKVAQILIEETETGDQHYNTWKEVFILLDMLCCVVILLSLIWSMKLLRECFQVSREPVDILKKLKLLKVFFFLTVFYIYSTRILVYMLMIAMPFQQEWLALFFQQLMALLFVVLVGYLFQPSTNNPYHEVAQIAPPTVA